MANLRFQVVGEAFKKKAVAVEAPKGLTSEYFGKYVFGREQMAKYLSKETVKVIRDVIDNGATLDRDIANHVAAGMKQWAMDLGAGRWTKARRTIRTGSSR